MNMYEYRWMILCAKTLCIQSYETIFEKIDFTDIPKNLDNFNVNNEYINCNSIIE